jgi:hypothetical protein
MGNCVEVIKPLYSQDSPKNLVQGIAWLEAACKKLNCTSKTTKMKLSDFEDEKKKMMEEKTRFEKYRKFFDRSQMTVPEHSKYD